MKIVRVKNAFTAVEVALVMMLLSMLIFVTTMIYSYTALQSARPLQNFTGHVISPVSLSKDTVLIAGGNFDRTVMCKLYDFHLYLTHVQSKETLMVGPETLAKPPVANVNPGKNIPIQFEVLIPSTMYPGVWTPRFEGRYICRNGLFTSHKIQEVEAPVFYVVE